MDSETKKVLGTQKSVQSLVSHEGWPAVRAMLIEKITDLQDVASLPLEGDAQAVLIDLKARRIAATTLFDWLRVVEGTATEALDNKPLADDYIVRL